jgi:hypothetical protein
MTELTADERNLVRDLLEEAEQNGYSRDRYRAIVSAALNERQIEGGQREAILDYARERAAMSKGLSSDRPDIGSVEEAQRLFRACAAELERAPWRTIVRESWPSPIAHEVERLLDELSGRRFGVVGRAAAAPDSALLQAKDSFEVLIKLTVTILMRSLIDIGGDVGDWARRELFRRNLLLGHWVGMLREVLPRCTSHAEKLPSPIAALTDTARARLLPAANEFVPVRNNFVGHGARALDPLDTARLVVGLVQSGRVADLRGRISRITPLSAVLAGMVRDGAFEGMQLEALDDDETVSLTGAQAAETWLEDPRHRDHQSRILPVRLRLADSSSLGLAPFVAARICNQCGRRDVMLYDSLYEAARGGRFDLLDYARGHKARLYAAEAQDLAAVLAQVTPEDAEDLHGESLGFGHVLEALDKARLDRDYLSPAYLRDDLAEFLTTHDSGVFWLQAPAHVGKTTFVQGLAEEERGDQPIDPRFDFKRRSGGKVVAYYCRKDYRTGLAGMINTLNDKLQAAYDPSQNLRNEQPDFRPVIAAGSPAAFVEWLAQWRDFAERHSLAPRGAPLLVAIDGLDEADPPPGSTPLQVLPRPEALPEGIYLVLTSRPVGDPDTPAFLASHVERLYGGD